MGAQASVRSMAPMMVVLSLGAIMTGFEATIVNVALDSLARDLGLSLTEAQWVGGAYLVALASAVPLTGWLTERLGAKRLWLSALGLFVGASVLCALSWSPGALIAFRVLQGVGGGMVLPVGQTMVVRRVGREGIGRVMGILTMPLLAGPILGPIIGGAVVDQLDWRWIFLINVPLGALTLLLAARVLADDERSHTMQTLDVRGLALLPPGLVLVVYALTRLGHGGGSGGAIAVACASGGLALIAAFGLHSRGKGRAALIDLSLFRRVEFGAAGATAFCFGLLMFGGLFVLPLYYQLVRGQSALHAGLLMAPQGVGSLIALPIAGRIGDRLGAGCVVPFGLAIAAASTWVFATADETTSYAALAVAQFWRGFGLSSVMTPAYAAAYSPLEREAVPRATSVMTLLNRVGGAFGGALVAAVLAHGAGQLVPASTGSIGLRALDALDAVHQDALAAELARVFGQAYLVLFAVTVLAFVPAALLPREPLRGGRGRSGAARR